MTKQQKTSWEIKIRQDYKNIVSEEQIEATVNYWRDFLSTLKSAVLEKMDGQKATEWPSWDGRTFKMTTESKEMDGYNTGLRTARTIVEEML